MRKWRAILGGGILATLAISASAADLNAPVEKKITLKSEIFRGSSAAWDCFSSRKDVYDWAGISKCVRDVINTDTLVNRITEPFKLGIFYQTYDLISILRDSVLKVTKKDFAADQAFLFIYRFYYNEAGKIQKSMGLSDDDICRALAGEAHEATARCIPLAPPP